MNLRSQSLPESLDLWGLVGPHSEDLILFLREGCEMWMWCLPSLDILHLGVEAPQKLFPLSVHTLIQDGCYLGAVVSRLVLLGHSSLPLKKRQWSW